MDASRSGVKQGDRLALITDCLGVECFLFASNLEKIFGGAECGVHHIIIIKHFASLFIHLHHEESKSILFVRGLTLYITAIHGGVAIKCR